MERSLFDSKSLSLPEILHLGRTSFSSHMSCFKHTISVKFTPQLSSSREVAPKASYSSTSNGTYVPKKTKSSLDQENAAAGSYVYQVNGTNGTSVNLYSTNVKVLDAFDDEYGGVVVDPEKLPANQNAFALMLRCSLSQWKAKGKKGIWLKLPADRSELVPVAVKEGFEYHHAERGYVMLTYWIPEGPSILPANASHQVGVGGFVINENNEVLVVQEKYCDPTCNGLWKIPTGYILESEEIFNGAVREVKEETGIDTEFVEVIAFRHVHNVAFEKSDLFFICMLKPFSSQIKVDDLEIQAAKWMPLLEFVEQPLIQGDNMFKKVIDICIARLGKRYCGLSPRQLLSTFDGKTSSLYYNIVNEEDISCRGN